MGTERVCAAIMLGFCGTWTISEAITSHRVALLPGLIAVASLIFILVTWIRERRGRQV